MYRNITQIAIMVFVLLLLGTLCQATSRVTEINTPPVDVCSSQSKQLTCNTNVHQKHGIAKKVVDDIEPNIIRISKEQLRGDFYEKAIECYRSEMNNFKWVIEVALTCMGIVIMIWGIVVGYLGYKNKKESESAAKKSESEAKKSESEAKKSESAAKKGEEERGLVELWSEAGVYYSDEDYRRAAEIWKKVSDKYKVESRPFYNNWGSSLLNWAGTTQDLEEQKRLAADAIEKYLKAEEFTEGIAAFNIACCYAILDDWKKCKEWLETAKRTGRLLSWERASKDRDLKKYDRETWFGEIWSKQRE
jgi:hypothetical protein